MPDEGFLGRNPDTVLLLSIMDYGQSRKRLDLALYSNFPERLFKAIKDQNMLASLRRSLVLTAGNSLLVFEIKREFDAFGYNLQLAVANEQN